MPKVPPFCKANIYQHQNGTKRWVETRRSSNNQTIEWYEVLPQIENGTEGNISNGSEEIPPKFSFKLKS